MRRFAWLVVTVSVLACGGRVTPTGDVTTTSDSGGTESDAGPLTAVDGGPSEFDASVGDDATFDSSDQFDVTTGYDTGVNCGATPSLHPDEGGTIYCGYETDGGMLLCQTGQECCIGGSLGGAQWAPQECAAFGSPCTNGDDGGQPPVPMECSQAADCVANGVASPVSCCLKGVNPPTDPPGCTYPKARYGTGMVCETSAQCAPGEVQICSVQTDCPNGTTCTAGKWKLFQVGFCL